MIKTSSVSNAELFRKLHIIVIGRSILAELEFKVSVEPVMPLQLFKMFKLYTQCSHLGFPWSSQFSRLLIVQTILYLLAVMGDFWKVPLVICSTMALLQSTNTHMFLETTLRLSFNVNNQQGPSKSHLTTIYSKEIVQPSNKVL